MNIKFIYLYRDAANYKQHNKVVFTNPNKFPPQEIRSIIRSRLIDNGWFIAKDLHLPDIHFKNYNWDDEIDHQWHELESIEERTEAETQPRSIEDFLELITVKQ